MRTSPAGIAFLAAHEGIVPGPYRDSVGVWTYGVGHTAAAGSPDPAKMPRGMPADLDAGIREALTLFARDLAQYEAAVNAVLRGRKVPQHEFDAAVSFHFNTGAIGRAEWVKLWLAGNVNAAGKSMVTNWRKPAAIVPRREAEAALLSRGVYGAAKITVWQVDSSGRVIWRPARTLAAGEVTDAVRGLPAARPAPKPQPVAGIPPAILIAAVIMAAAAILIFA